MPIAPLPSNAVRAIGSTQVLTTTTSLVKELIDNAIDARASSIFVEISSNTLDVVQVKDNGHGIAPDDRDNVGRRHSTSKIRDLEELKTLGGSMLGFRGEALASAIELAASLSVVTRAEGEVVACKMSIDRPGQIERKEPASHPVGTTVRVTGFMKHLPVRREAALKSSVKTLTKIKELVQTYALARPRIRFSLKVLRAKTDKGDWSYAPAGNASMADAASKVAGKDTAGQCSLSFYSGLDHDISHFEDAVARGEGFRIEAFLPRPDAGITIFPPFVARTMRIMDITEYSKINDKGHFIFIDSRPVSCIRNSLKQILTLYKSYLRSSMSLSSETLKNPFICMNLQCPPGSYDPNVEPAKDDVLFESPELVLSIIESFFRTTYGEREEIEREVQSSKPKRTEKVKGFEVLLARKNGTAVDAAAEGAPPKRTKEAETFSAAQEFSAQNPPSDTEQMDDDGIHRSNGMARASPTNDHGPDGEPVYRPNMYGDFEDEFNETLDSSPPPGPSPDDECPGQQNSAAISNPWVVARMNAPVRPMAKEMCNAVTDEFAPNAQLATPSVKNAGLPARARDMSSSDIAQRSPVLPPSPQTNSSPQRRVMSSPSWRGSTHRINQEKESRMARKNSGGSSDAFGRNKFIVQEGSDSVHSLDSGLAQDTSLIGDLSRHRLRGDDPSDRDGIREEYLRSSHDTSNGPTLFMESGDQIQKQPELKQGNRFKPFVSPVVKSSTEGPRFGVSPQSKISRQAQGCDNRRDNKISRLAEFDTENNPIERFDVEEAIGTIKPAHPDVELLLDYERRKQVASKQRQHKRQTLLVHGKQETAEINGGFVSARHALPTKNPHLSRRKIALESLSKQRPDHGAYSAPLAEGDIRAFAGKEAGASGSGKSSGLREEGQERLRRKRAKRFPLETIPEKFRLQHLVSSISTDLDSIERSIQQMDSCDEYLKGENLQFKPSLQSDEDDNDDDAAAAALKGNLMELVKATYRGENEQIPNVQLKLNVKG
ncbi:MAG: hypothetical protein M1837_001099 [Sclerophora amabilis]|nr:MAG: hypothetical protein M1837_001099 [Sclerophora amabilis]